MKTDALYYRLFQELPDSFFALVGRPRLDAHDFRFESIEIKHTAVRIDGVYARRQPDEQEPVFIVEFQNYKSERTYSNLLLKIGLYLEKVNPRQNWHAVVIYPSRSIEQENLYPYRALLNSEQLTRVYLEEHRDSETTDVGLRILRIIGSKPNEAVEQARQLIPLIRATKESVDKQERMVELIETAVLCHLPHLSRKELENMLQVESFRETKVFQEALEEGMEKGIKDVALRMLAEKFPVQKIANLTGLSVAAIKQLKKKRK